MKILKIAFCTLSFKNYDCHLLESHLFDSVQLDDNKTKHQTVTNNKTSKNITHIKQRT